MTVDKNFCMSSYLMFRYVYDSNKQFTESQKTTVMDINYPRAEVTNADELFQELKSRVEAACQDGKAALALSGGIDSAILAKFMPEGSTAYTFRCVVPGKQVTDETEKAKAYADACNLKHKVVNITWEDVDGVADKLMKHKQSPIHSIEAQIYLAACQAKSDGFSKMIFGELADTIYGGFDGLLSKDWRFSDFLERYSYVMPHHALRHPEILTDPYLEFLTDDGHIDMHAFINKYYRQEALGTYNNACNTAGIKFVGPYTETNFTAPLDYQRIRNGESKYVIREVFHRLYPDMDIPKKIPMPRPVSEWMSEHYKEGPKRPEFVPHCTENMKGDQQWMVYCLERFLNLIG